MNCEHPHCIREQTPAYAKQSHGEEKNKIRHANKQKEREAAGDRSRSEGTWLMGTSGTKPGTECVEGRSPPKQLGREAVPRSKNCSHQTWPANWQAQLLAPWCMDMAPGSSKLRRGATRNLPRPLQYQQFTLVHSCYGPVLSRRKCDQG